MPTNQKVDKALDKARKLCSLSEQCIFDLRQKLRSFDLSKEQFNSLIQTLNEEQFLDEKRYTAACVNDKLRFNKWGKNKIRYFLKQKQINSDYIEKELSQINDDEYEQIVKHELEKKSKSIKESDPVKRKNKLISFAQSRGYEWEIINTIVNSF